MRQEGWGPGNGLKGSKSNKPAIQNHSVRHRVIEKAEFHTIVNQFHPLPILTTCFLTKLIICRAEHCGQTAGTPASYVRVPVLNICPQTGNPDRCFKSPSQVPLFNLKIGSDFFPKRLSSGFHRYVIKMFRNEKSGRTFTY